MDYGQYFFGNDRVAADDLFNRLKGSPKIKDTCLLHIGLMETMNGLLVKMKTICCTLEELGANCKLIAREVFRLRTWRNWYERKNQFYGSLLFCLLFIDGIYGSQAAFIRCLAVINRFYLTGFLLWFVSLVSRRDRNDDWVKQF